MSDKEKTEKLEGGLAKLVGALGWIAVVAIILAILSFLAPGMLVVALLQLPFRLLGHHVDQGTLLLLAATASLGLLVALWTKTRSLKAAAVAHAIVGVPIVLVIGGLAVFSDVRWASEFFSIYFGSKSPTMSEAKAEISATPPAEDRGSPSGQRTEPASEARPLPAISGNPEAVTTARDAQDLKEKPKGASHEERGGSVSDHAGRMPFAGSSASSKDAPPGLSAMRDEIVTGSAPPRAPTATTPRTPAEVAWESGDWSSAFPLYLKNAETGEPDAQVRIGFMYYEGLGRLPDMRLAEQWYRRAAEKDSTEAKYRLGLLYSEARKDAPWDLTVAHQFLVEAADSNAEAALKLGHFYWNGIGVQEDKEQARNWYKRAAKMGSREAADWLRSNR
jgi:Sel1 repeat